MKIDDDEIRAAANRLRQAGWTDTGPAFGDGTKPEGKQRRHLKTSPVDPDGGLIFPTGKAMAAAEWLAEHRDEAIYPLRQFMVDKFHLSYDEAVQAVSEAERLSGESL
jgi:hypothetical protein